MIYLLFVYDILYYIILDCIISGWQTARVYTGTVPITVPQRPQNGNTVTSAKKLAAQDPDA